MWLVEMGVGNCTTKWGACSFQIWSRFWLHQLSCCLFISDWNQLFAVMSKGKAMPLTGRGGPRGSETSRLPHVLDNRLTEGGEVVSLTRRPAAFYPPPPSGRFLVLISVIGWVDPRTIVRLEGLGQVKNPVSSFGIVPATSRFVA
jgi:hypothetical protein